MTCEKVRFPDGTVAIVCGGKRKKTMAEKQLTELQQKFLNVTRNASARCFLLASEADDLGLPILAREYNYLGKELDEKIGLQLLAFRNGTLSQP